MRRDRGDERPTPPTSTPSSRLLLPPTYSHSLFYTLLPPIRSCRPPPTQFSHSSRNSIPFPPPAHSLLPEDDAVPLLHSSSAERLSTRHDRIAFGHVTLR